MPEQYIQLPADSSGKKAHTFERMIGANTVQDEVVLLGLPYLASYSAVGVGMLITTTNDHILQIMAGASLNVYVTRVYLYQGVNAGAAAISGFEVMRLSTAGTGGGVITPTPFDLADAASGATVMSRPTAGGTITTRLFRRYAIIRGAVPSIAEVPLMDEDWGPPAMTKPIKISAGTANGLAVRVTTGVATATVDIGVEFFEANF